MTLQYHYLAIYGHVPHDFLLYRNKMKFQILNTYLFKVYSLKYIFLLFIIFVSFEYGLKISYIVYINGPTNSEGGNILKA